MLIEQIIEFELKGPETPRPYMYFFNWLFLRHDKTKISWEYRRVDYFIICC